MPPLSSYVAKLTALLAALGARLYPDGVPRHHKFVAAALLCSIALFVQLDAQLSALSRERNEAEVAALAATISNRMETYAEILTGAAGLFYVVGQVPRQTWKRYFDLLSLDESLPGIQGLGFNPLVSAQEKPAHEGNVRAEGIPEYSIWPKGEREQYTPVVLIEPFSGRNLRALGYDTYSDEVRRRAMLTAKETRKPALTDRIVLVQETGKEIQHGYVMFHAVYRIGPGTRDMVEKTSELIGWVSAPFRVDDLLKAVLGAGRFESIAFELYDGTDLQNPIYAHSPTNRALRLVSGEEYGREVPVADKRWLLRAKRVNVGGWAEIAPFVKWFLAIALVSCLLLVFLRDKKNAVEGAGNTALPPQPSPPDPKEDSSAPPAPSVDALLTQAGLTARQKEVTRMLVAGASNKAICRELKLSEATVKVHVSAILKALRVHSRYQLTNALNDFGHKREHGRLRDDARP